MWGTTKRNTHTREKEPTAYIDLGIFPCCNQMSKPQVQPERAGDPNKLLL